VIYRKSQPEKMGGEFTESLKMEKEKEFVLGKFIMNGE